MKYTVDEIIEYVETSIDHNDFADDEAWFSRTMREEILNALKKCQWIPVSERLPKILDDVLISTERQCLAGYLDTDDVWRVGNESIEDYWEVIAWMPLPEPYEGGGITK